MKKRILSMLLCLVMVFGLLPGQAIAVGNLPFNDVKVTSWFYDEVKYVYENGLMTGTSDTTFSPNGTTTRGMVVTILWRLDGEPDSTEMRFADVAAGRYYTDAVMWASSNNIAGGHGDGNFGPNDPITREQLAVILYRYAHHKGYDVSGEADLSAFTDRDTTSDYAVNAMAWANDTGLITGVTDTTLAPLGNATRAQVAAILMRFCEGVVKAIDGVDDEINEEPDIADEEDDSKGPDKPLSRPPHRPDDSDTYYTITFDANGSDVENLPKVQRVKAGECAVEPDEPTKLIHDFGGWYTDSSCTNPFDFSTPITSNITLYAKWNITIYAKPIDESHVKTGVLECDGEEYEGMYIDNQLIVVSREGVGLEEIEALADLYGGHVVGQNSSVGMYQVEFAKTRTKEELEALAEDFLQGPVESAYLHRVYEMQNDAYYPNDLQDRYAEAPDAYENYEYCWNTFLWGHDACYVPEAWEVVLAETENPSIVMGLIDDSFDARHEDLNFFRCFMHKDQYNPFEVAASNPAAAEHGTHVAGIMGAVTNNGRGISGVALNASLIGVSVRDRDGDEGFLMGAMSWNNDISLLIENGAKVINISLGMEQKTAIDKASAWLKAKASALDLKLTLDHHYNQGKDFLIVTSAGNNGEDNGDTNYNNAFCNISEEYLKDRIIVVGNAARLGSEYVRSERSSYLGGRVDVMAPGTGIGGGIYSTLPNNRYGGTMLNREPLNGTSMAAPFVAGLAGLIWEANPNLTPERVKEIIVSTANIDVADSDANMVNAEAAVIEALGYDPRTKDITFSFVDTSTDSAIKARLVSWKGVEYSPKYEFHPELDLNDLKLTYWVMNGDENSTISTVPYTVPYGEFKFEFEAPGYQKTTVAFSVDNDTDVITINMTPEGMVIPPVGSGYTVSGRLVSASDGLPIANMNVKLKTNSNIHIDNINSYSTTTDSNGYFSFQDVEAQTDYILRSCDGVNYQYYQIDSLSVTQDTDLGTIELTPTNASSKTMRICFVDADSGEILKISDIFEDTSYIGIGHSGLSEGEEFIAGDFIDGGRGTNAFTVNDDKELVFGDVPVIEEMGNYYVIFDSVEKGYLFPNTYTIPSLDLVENAAGEWTAEIELEKVALIVGDVAVTSENALDILGDGTARYDAGSGVLTLTNANITADYVVSTNMDQLTVEIPSGTTTTLTIAPVDYRGYTAAIEASRDLSILGGGTLIINGDKEVNAICGGYQYSNDEEYELSISDVTVQMPSNNTTGITANRGNLILRNATVLKTGEEDYGHLITGKSIDIIESKIEVISAGTKLIWSAGGDITIVDSVIKLDVDSTRNVYYSIFAEMGAISISGTSAIEIISEETDTSTDYEFLTATNGIQVEDGLLITGSDNVLCEIYQNSSLDSYSVRYKEEEERYPTMISVAGSSW